MFKQLLLIVLLAVAINMSSARPHSRGGRGRGGRGPKPMPTCGRTHHQQEACGITFPNDTFVPLDDCHDGLVCQEAGLTVTRDGESYGLHFCNSTFELKPDMACRLLDVNGTAVCNESACIVDTCSSPTEVLIGKHGESLTATFCGASLPTEFNYGASALRRACGYQLQGEDAVALRMCPGEVQCPTDNSLSVPFQGVDLTVNYCAEFTDVLSIFDDEDRDSHESNSDESNSDESTSDESNSDESTSDESNSGGNSRRGGGGNGGRGNRRGG